MATFFGEILPISSRAVDDDEDEDELPTEALKTVAWWSPRACDEMERSTSGRIPCSIVIIAVGSTATAFGHVYLMNRDTDRLGVICGGLSVRDANTIDQLSPVDRACFVYRLRDIPQAIVIMCNEQVPPEQSFSWCQEVFSKLEQEKTYVAVLSSSAASEFRCDVPVSDLKVPFMRALRTPQFKGTPTCPYLEQPNTMSGLPAQILSYCQIHHMAGVVYTCYTETMFLDQDTIQMYQKVLSTTPFKDIVKTNPKAKEMLEKLVYQHAQQNNTLYI